MTLKANVKVTVTSGTKLGNVGARTLKHSRGVSSDQKITLRAKVMAKVIITFRAASLLGMLCIIIVSSIIFLFRFVLTSQFYRHLGNTFQTIIYNE